MSIKIISVSDNGYTARLKCFNCGHEEESQKRGMFLSWSDFEEHNDNASTLIRTCLKCGFQSPRISVTFGKYLNSDVIHLCVNFDGESISARCGTLSGSLLKGECVEVSEIDTSSRLCKKCAIDMGAYRNDQIWKSEQGKEKELSFYRLL